ncbi:MAG: hypothetical protein HZC45_06480 [Deltaproteobacteria bacterium]|nr:hypothetical protein [Deltaproteobacteria bacterium]
MPVFDRGTEGSWDDFQAAYPFVMKDGDGYKMWYYGYGKTPNHPPGIGYATSIDGVHWQRYKENPVLSPGEEDSWDNEMLGYPVIIKEDSLYKMWYAGTNRFEEWKIGYAESKDGINWTKLLAPVVDSGEMNDWDGLAVSYPMVLPVEQGYLMWYTGINTKQNGDPAMRIGTAFSKDGITWLKTSTNPVLDIGDEGEWNEASSLSPRVILDNDTWKIWFTGFDRDRIFSIGYTEKAVSGER